MKKYNTSYGTYYLVDEENELVLRVKGENRNDMEGDGEWFRYIYITAYDWDTREFLGEPRVGKAIFFNLDRSYISHDYRITTDVTSIEEV